MSIKENVQKLRQELPADVALVIAAKGRQPEEIRAAIQAGASIIGENYLQEAESACKAIGCEAAWHFIGHLQRNKARKAVSLFDMIQTVDSMAMACEIDRRCREIGKVMPVLVEVNSGREERKSGVLPEAVEQLVRQISDLSNIKVMGLMTMGPRPGEGRSPRAAFAETRRLFERLKGLGLPNTEMKYLSMGMTDSYRIAIEEGANMVRLGTKIFDEDGTE
ncbi:MAG: YggS family pyridoxal phosphate-dependent enzyme [Chloroflexi bacterium]|nr:YggS family pyridoxal phosphate-dependent enzyme [Chloroflexota bacterium]